MTVRCLRRFLAGARLLAIALLAVVAPVRAMADIASDHPAAILVFPKLVVDTANGLDTLVRISNTSNTPLNVLCYYVNVTPRCTVTGGSCFPDQLECQAEIGGQIFRGDCVPQWQPTDFNFRLTSEQPTGWLVSAGQVVNCRFMDGVCSQDGTTPCQRDTQCGAGNRCVLSPCLPLDGGPFGRTGPNNQTNEGAIPPSPDDPFIGELKCIAVDETLAPVARNDLIGTALIGKFQSGPTAEIEIAGYNAIGIPAIPGKGNRDHTLVLGGPAESAEYEGCPNILILDHYFDGAVDPLLANVCRPDGTCSISGAPCANNAECVTNRCVMDRCTVTGGECQNDDDCTNRCVDDSCTLSGASCSGDGDCVPADFQVKVATDLTLIPCTEDFENQRESLRKTTAQILVFNEFEQRFSTSRLIDCFKEIQLSNMETTDNTRSIFSAGVGGTLTGQTRIRGVVNEENAGKGGNTLLGIAEEFRCAGAEYEFPRCDRVNSSRLVGGSAGNLHFQGRRPQSDFIYLP